MESNPGAGEDTAWYRAFFEDCADGLFVGDLSGRILEVNPEACRQLGYSRGELLHMRIPAINTPEQAVLFQERISRLRTNETVVFNTAHLRRDGSSLPVEVRARLIQFRGAPAFLGIVRDISERMRLEEDLRRREARLIQTNTLLEAMLDGIPDIVGIQKPDHTMVRYNRAGYAALGLVPEQVEGRKCYELIGRAQPCAPCATAQAKRSGAIEVVERFVPELGKFIEARSNPVFDDRGNLVLMIEQLRDITGRKRIEDELRSLNQNLEERVRERTTELAATVEELNAAMRERQRLEKMIRDLGEEERERIGRDIHDVLGQTLTALSIKSQVLLTRLERANRAEADEARSIQETAQTAGTQARDLSRLLFPIELKNQNLATALHALCAYTESHIGVECLLAVQSRTALDFDLATATHLYRIAQESVSNAVRHGQARKIQIELNQDEDEGFLIVSDNGRGYDPKSRKTLGRGLRIMTHRAGLIGGHLEIRPGLKGGTVVTCAFPATSLKTGESLDEKNGA